MIPNNPGYWWWEGKNGQCHIARFDDNMMCSTAPFSYYSVDMVEDSYDFIRWLGPAHPPNRVERYRAVFEEHCGLRKMKIVLEEGGSQ